MIRLKQNGVRWELIDQFEPLLDKLLADRGRTVKESPAKLVTVHEIDGATFYVKRYRNDAVPLRSLKFFFKESHSRREWTRAHKIEALGVPIVRHLALGERWGVVGLRESILNTEGFNGVQLHLCPERDGDEVQAVLGRLLRQMHDRGVLQRDLYHNILVQSKPLELKRVDVHHAEVKPALTQQERLDNLAFLNFRVPLADACFRAYGWNQELAEQTRQRSAVMRRQHLCYRSKRCLKRNAEFAPMRLGRLKCWVRLPYLDDRLRHILNDPDEFLEHHAETLKGGRTSTVGRSGGLVVKRFNLRKATNLIKNYFRHSRARRAFRKAYHLELVGIPTAKPIAAAERRIARFLLRSYFVMEEIPGAIDFGEWRGDKQQSMERVAELLAKLHNEGFSHRDLKETNIVFDEAGRLYLIDLEGLRFVGEIPFTRAAADLARFAEALGAEWPELENEFLAHYCGRRGLAAGQSEFASQITSYLGGRA